MLLASAISCRLYPGYLFYKTTNARIDIYVRGLRYPRRTMRTNKYTQVDGASKRETLKSKVIKQIFVCEKDTAPALEVSAYLTK